ncbi:MAG: hypothetical protein IJV25_06690 [Prevotella sp.]|mgnify:CR=1 FL=1|nr:hypothetical protein [Prevotella sp.]
MNTVTKSITVSLILLTSVMVTSCNDYNYTEQLQNLGRRVEVLEETLSDYNADLSALQVIVNTLETQGYITHITNHNDGSYTLTFNTNETITIRDGKQGRDGQDGRDGQVLDFMISVAKDADGIWYWTMNGEWMLDAEGNKFPASATDGKDGRDGKDGHDGQNNPDNPAIIPQVRINEDTRLWEISTDGGKTWQNTGVSADGKDGINGQNGKDGKDGKDGVDGSDGKDGKDGADGLDDIFETIVESEDGKSITITLTDGQAFTVPIIN